MQCVHWEGIILGVFAYIVCSFRKAWGVIVVCLVMSGITADSVLIMKGIISGIWRGALQQLGQRTENEADGTHDQDEGKVRLRRSKHIGSPVAAYIVTSDNICCPWHILSPATIYARFYGTYCCSLSPVTIYATTVVCVCGGGWGGGIIKYL